MCITNLSPYDAWKLASPYDEDPDESDDHDRDMDRSDELYERSFDQRIARGWPVGRASRFKTTDF